MNKWVSLLANIGVFAGLILVAYQLDQSQTQLELSAAADGSDNFVQAMEVLAQDDDLSKLIYKAEVDYGNLDQFERWRISKYLDGFTTMSEQDYRVSVKSGDVEVAVGLEIDWRENMALAMYRDYWERKEQRFSAEFRQLINGILVEQDAGKNQPL